MDEVKVDRDDTCLHFLFHLTNTERFPEILLLINDVNWFFFCIKIISFIYLFIYLSFICLFLFI